MTPRTFHIAILRNAALLVPVSDRAEWMAEWKAELHYVDHHATAFCLGSFRDALWLRCNAPSPVRETLTLDSPMRCVFFLLGLVLLAFSLSLRFGEQLAVSWSLQGIEQCALGWLWACALSLLVLLTLGLLNLGAYPATCYAPPLAIRLRRWMFLCIKIGLLAPVPFFICAALAPVFPPVALVLLPSWILGSRWILSDQRRRCPVCLHLLSHPVGIGSPAEMVFGWYGTELICTRGHGLLYVPEARTTWCDTQRWQYLDPTWSHLLP